VRPIGTVSLTPEIEAHVGVAKGSTVRPGRIGRAIPYPVSTFRELIEHVARLAVLNKDCVFYYRGQAIDYKNQAGSSTLYPTIYRGAQVSQTGIRSRFALLRRAADILLQLIQKSHLEGKDDIRKRLVQWSLLQHYEICGTPLLDFSSSLRVACSFALEPLAPPEPTIYVCGLPYPSGRISVNSEHDIVNVRLLGICPPSALRPLLQEGHEAGTYDVEEDYDRKNKVSLDFANRLIAKFGLPRVPEFRDEVSAFDHDSLYPQDDPLLPIANEVRQSISMGRRMDDESDTPLIRDRSAAAELGYFLEVWTKLEQLLLGAARMIGKDARSVMRAVGILAQSELLGDRQAQLLGLAELRNKAVHLPESVPIQELRDARRAVEELLEWAREVYALAAERTNPRRL